MVGPDPRLLDLTFRYAVPRAAHDDIKVHAKDTDRGIVSRTEVNVLLNPKPKVARLGKVAPTEFVLLHLETALEDLLGLGPANGDVHGNLLVATDAKLADRVAGFGRDGCLTGQLLEDFGSSRQTVTRLSDRYVYENRKQRGDVTGSGWDRKELNERRTDDELLYAEIAHCVGRGCLRL